MKTTATAFALLAVISTPAMAAPTISVETSDLNLATAEGQARLDTRINTAIRQACRVSDRSLHSARTERACRAELENAAQQHVAKAMAKDRAPRLAAQNTDIAG